jgi:glutaredoxin
MLYPVMIMEVIMNVTVYSKDSCVFCDKAINLLKTTDLDYNVLKLGNDFTRDELLENFPEARTFPVITLDGMFVGGYDQLVEVIDEWKRND